jgi:hypothetical protein
MRRAKKHSGGGIKRTSIASSKSSKKENQYSPVGYNRGDLTTLKTMFDENSVCGLLSYDSFVESRYLRFWPGRASDAMSIWNDILGSCEKLCSFKEMIEIQNILDEMSMRIENEMERERIQWNLDDMNYDNMINFFHDCMNEETHLLSFQKFIKWDFIEVR